MSFRLTPQAEADLVAISDYIAADNPGAARRLLDRFHECFGLLGMFPQLGVFARRGAAGTSASSGRQLSDPLSSDRCRRGDRSRRARRATVAGLAVRTSAS